MSPYLVLATRLRENPCQRAATALYEKHGVPEYWIVESSGGILEVYRLDESGLFTRSGACGSGETISPATPPAVSGYGGTQ